ncbi:hypothetical protein LEP1GSC148_0386 [Leptospira interrogans serovar Canicola str. LT1962]|nr:hypothetical protein LEP1GSC148_0386 [Leptospira interrogans serovar Canicola str. LT1962]
MFAFSFRFLLNLFSLISLLFLFIFNFSTFYFSNAKSSCEELGASG